MYNIVFAKKGLAAEPYRIGSVQTTRKEFIYSEFAICPVVRHGNVSGRRIKQGSIDRLVTVEGF